MTRLVAEPALLDPTRADAPAARRSESRGRVRVVPLVCLAAAVGCRHQAC
jgi:hypothetical protein